MLTVNGSLLTVRISVWGNQKSMVFTVKVKIMLFICYRFAPLFASNGKNIIARCGGPRGEVG